MTEKNEAEAPATVQTTQETAPGTVVPLLPRGALDDIALEAGTDKSSRRHDYMRFYEYLLAPYRDQEFTFLELGVGLPARKAPSLRSWKTFFPKAQIVGVDIRKVSKDFEEDRIKVEIGDASRPRFLTRVFRRHRPSVILDDASHFWSHQIIGFETLFPLLPPGGIYIIEDVHTSFLADPAGSQYADHPESLWSYVARLQAALACAQRHGPELSAQEQRLVAWIDAIFVSRRCVVFLKRAEMRRSEVSRDETSS